MVNEEVVCRESYNSFECPCIYEVCEDWKTQFEAVQARPVMALSMALPTELAPLTATLPIEEAPETATLPTDEAPEMAVDAAPDAPETAVEAAPEAPDAAVEAAPLTADEAVLAAPDAELDTDDAPEVALEVLLDVAFTKSPLRPVR